MFLDMSGSANYHSDSHQFLRNCTQHAIFGCLKRRKKVINHFSLKRSWPIDCKVHVAQSGHTGPFRQNFTAKFCSSFANWPREIWIYLVIKYICILWISVNTRCHFKYSVNDTVWKVVAHTFTDSHRNKPRFHTTCNSGLTRFSQYLHC